MADGDAGVGRLGVRMTGERGQHNGGKSGGNESYPGKCPSHRHGINRPTCENRVADALGVEPNKEYATLGKVDFSRVTR